jgi:hypothetical protein
MVPVPDQAPAPQHCLEETFILRTGQSATGKATEVTLIKQPVSEKVSS